MTVKISVALATYNGATYLADQLKSLANQDHLPFELVIGDDGSSDNTIEIIEDFLKVAPFKVRLIKNPVNLGYGLNFLNIAKNCSSDWVAFCDQDDVWLPNKLRLAAESVSKNPSVSLVLQRAIYCNADLSIKQGIVPNELNSGLYKPNNIPGVWVWHGCCQIFNTKLLKTYGVIPPDLLSTNDKISHDYIISWLANAIGDILVTNDATMLYRRHENASSIGTHPISRPKKNKFTLRERLSFSKNKSRTDILKVSKIASELAFKTHEISKYFDKKNAERLNRSAALFKKMSLLSNIRHDIYSKKSVKLRLFAFLKVLFKGGYFGCAFYSLGWRQFIKDFFMSFSAGNVCLNNRYV